MNNKCIIYIYIILYHVSCHMMPWLPSPFEPLRHIFFAIQERHCLGFHVPCPLHVFSGGPWHRQIRHVTAVIAAGIDSEVVFILVGTVKNLWLDMDRCDMLWCPTKGAWCAMNERAHSATLGLGTLNFRLVLLFVNHVFACLWFLIGIMDEGAGGGCGFNGGRSLVSQCFTVPCSLADVEEMTTGFSTTRPTLVHSDA